LLWESTIEFQGVVLKMLNKVAPTPLHIQLYEILKQKVENGEYKPHDIIPSESQLSKIYNVSRTTVRNVILRLANEQIIYRVAGKGTFVCENKITTSSIAQKGIREQLEEMGYETGTTLLENNFIHADSALAHKLHINEGDGIIHIKRIRYVNGTPLSMHTNYLVAKLFPNLLDNDVASTPLCNILQYKYNVTAKYGEETLESITSNSLESKLLEVPNSYPFLLLECKLYDQNNVPYEYSRVVFRGDRIKLKFKYDREK
jgi:GntR family transcriptional regulator